MGLKFIVDDSNIVAVRARIKAINSAEQSGSVRLTWDTGATRSVVAWSALSVAGYTKEMLGDTVTVTVANGSKNKLRFVTLEEMTLNDSFNHHITLKNIIVCTNPLQPFSNLLGMDIIKMLNNYMVKGDTEAGTELHVDVRADTLRMLMSASRDTVSSRTRLYDMNGEAIGDSGLTEDEIRILNFIKLTGAMRNNGEGNYSPVPDININNQTLESLIRKGYIRLMGDIYVGV